jgi:molybdopterin-containing oxidoreductase family membrane subunit
MGLVDYADFLSYTPSMHENLVVMGGVAFCLMLFLMVEKLFRGHVSEDH